MERAADVPFLFSCQNVNASQIIIIIIIIIAPTLALWAKISGKINSACINMPISYNWWGLIPVLF